MAARKPGRLRVTAAAGMACLLFAAGLTLAAGPALAQGNDVLVSNARQTLTGTGSSFELAQSFTTGPNAGGYSISKIRIRLFASEPPSSSDGSFVTIKTDVAGSPGTIVATLNNPATFRQSALNGFTAPAGTTLKPDTTYWIVINEGSTSGLTVANTNSDGEDSGSLEGPGAWMIGDGSKWRRQGTTEWNDSSASRVIKVRGEKAASTTPDVTDDVLRAPGDPVVTIAAVESSIIAGVDTASFTLTRTGLTTDELVVDVEIEQDRPYLSASNLTQAVTIPVGSATATLAISASSFRRLPTGTVVTHGRLTVRAVDSGDYDVVPASSVDVDVFPPVTLGFEFDSYVVDEGIGVVTGHLVALTGEGAAKPSTAISFPVSTLPIGEAEPPDDFAPLSELIRIAPGDYVMVGSRYRAALPFEIEIVDDINDEDDERFGLVLTMDIFFQFVGLGGYLITPTGENCGNECGCVDDRCKYALTIPEHLERDMPRVLVTNMSETSTTGSSNNIHAQSFVTGPLLVGYRVSEVGLYLRSSAALSTSSTTFAAIKTDDSGSPGTSVADFTNPAGFTDDAINFFTAPEDTILAPSTTYWLVVNDEISTASDRAGVVATDSNADESLEDPAWAIGDVRFTRAATADSWTEEADALKMEIVGKGAWIELTAEATINDHLSVLGGASG